MDLRRETPIREVNGGQMEGSWIPVTPVKPGTSEWRPICTDKQQNRQSEASWLLPERYSQENQQRDVTACSGLTNSADVYKEFEHWKDNLAATSQLQGNDADMYNKLTMEYAERYNNVSFQDLLALADAASSKSEFHTQIDGNQSERSSVNSSLENHDMSFGSDFLSSSNACSFPSRPSFDLNAPPRMMTDAILTKSFSAQFAPVTPGQVKRVEKRQVSNIQSSSKDGRSNEASDKQHKEVAFERVEVEELHHEKDQSYSAVSTQLEENHNPDKGGNEGTDSDKAVQQKPRRRKHRPKVVIERQSQKIKKPRNPTSDGPEETPKVKRKYVRKKGLNNSPGTPTSEVTSGATAPVTAGPRKSCRRSLDFNMESKVRDGTSPSTINSESNAQSFRTSGPSTVQLGQGMEVTVERTEMGIAYDLTCSLNRELEDYLAKAHGQAPGPSTPCKSDLPRDMPMANAHACTRGKCRIVFSDETHDKETTTELLNAIPHPSGEQERGLKRGHSSATDEEELCSLNEIEANYNSLQAYLGMLPVDEYNSSKSPVHFPVIFKKKRTEKGQNSTTSSMQSSVTAEQNSARQTANPLKDLNANPFRSESDCSTQLNTHSAPFNIPTASGAHNKQHSFKCMLGLGHPEGSKKKRSKSSTRVRDLASLIGIVESIQFPGYTAKGATTDVMQGFQISHPPHTCMEALVADNRTTMATKKRTKRNSLVCSVPPGIRNHHQFLTKSMGLPRGVIWKGMSSIDQLVEEFRHLDINVESNQIAYQEQGMLIPYHIKYQDQNALVLYRRDGTLVPFEGSFDAIKKRRPRPKVELDDETTRVWKLLLQDINSEGIDGTDEQKAKWWEEERGVFRGRADSFIARMHLVQGDRRFSKWKGSVLDSVVGVFLTQNVSDHLSSSAFMSMAAHFPLKSKYSNGPAQDERSIMVKEPEVCVLDPDDTISWHEVKSNQDCDQNSITLHDVEFYEEKEVVNSNGSFGSSTDAVGSKDISECKLSDISKTGLGMYKASAINRSATEGIEQASSFEGYQQEWDDFVSGQNSVVSSQTSVESSIAQTAETIGSCWQSNSELKLEAGSTPNNLGGSTSFVELLRMQGNMLHGVYNQGNGNMSCSKKFGQDQSEGMACDSKEQDKERLDGQKASLRPIILSGNHDLHLTTSTRVPEVECFDILGEESRFSEGPKQSEAVCTSEQSELSAESATQANFQKMVTPNSKEAQKDSSEDNHPCNSLQAEGNSIFQSQRKGEVPGDTLDVTESTSNIINSRKVEQSTVQSNLSDLHKTLNGTNTDTSKAKRARTGKEKQNAVDWDSLRKQAQANRKREKTSSTMNSLDWEAVRCADVNEIAETIRERGMNNMLAERIKDFLNRLVRDHGSTDLEWLRDVPPDKAKEYLLSIRGLGLKSVECVRLLTLHHLAFPVDTNVGRIAVRLGWVPLQPLPESLQLHLLELYPVLESIQKFLWPRLCKLDQRTLYELHYQMITFGKVFCTKSKPNCNACPMRGECRHFASAFASARLALPAPEEKRIVNTIGNKAADQSTMGTINPLQLPLPQANQQQEAKSEVINYGPIIEVPSTPEPIIEVPVTPEPIIEVPATPEPERTQISEFDIEDACEDPEEIPTIKLNIEEFTQNLQNYMQQNMELREGEMSKALVALTPEAAAIPMPKLKNVNRLRTEHQVYELPDSHPLLEGLDKREPDDPCSYLLAIWTPGETAESIQPPEGRCSSQDFGKLCDEKTCFSCNSVREANNETVRGTLLIPCRTAMRGSFPLNGTYFQVNEVFADHESSINPIDVPRSWLWNLPRRTVYFGTSIPTIFKGLTTEGIQYCFWRGFVCVRGFDQKSRGPRPLMARLHFPASKLARGKGRTDET